MRVAGVTGGSGSGKTALARAVAGALGEQRTLLLSQDDYYLDLSHLPLADRGTRNFDEPAASDLDLLAAHLVALRRGESVVRPRYDMRTHTRGPGETVTPRPFVLVDGTMIAAHEGLRRSLDLLVFVELPDEGRLARRLERDTGERSRTPKSVRRQWAATVLPMHRLHVEPIRALAHLVVPGDAPLETTARRVARLVRPGLLRRAVEGLREHRRRKRLRAEARSALRGLFLRPEQLRGTSLRPEHAGRAVLLDFEATGTRVVALTFGILRHPRPHPFSRQFHEVLEFWRADLCGYGPVERVKGVNLSRLRGRDGEPSSAGPGV